MKRSSMFKLKAIFLSLFAFFAFVIYADYARAGDQYSTQTNLNNMADMMSGWSKELSTGKMEPKAQEKLGELMSLMSQVLRDMSTKSGSDMDMDHKNKIETMKKEWDPFDTADKM